MPTAYQRCTLDEDCYYVIGDGVHHTTKSLLFPQSMSRDRYPFVTPPLSSIRHRFEHHFLDVTEPLRFLMSPGAAWPMWDFRNNFIMH